MNLLSGGDQLAAEPVEPAAHAGVKTMGTNL